MRSCGWPSSSSAKCSTWPSLQHKSKEPNSVSVVDAATTFRNVQRVKMGLFNSMGCFTMGNQLRLQYSNVQLFVRDIMHLSICLISYLICATKWWHQDGRQSIHAVGPYFPLCITLLLFFCNCDESQKDEWIDSTGIIQNADNNYLDALGSILLKHWCCVL